MSQLHIQTVSGLYVINMAEVATDQTPNPADADVFYVPDYFASAGSGDLTGTTDSTAAFYLAVSDAETYAAANGAATVYLGQGSLRMHPATWQSGFMYAMLYYMTVDNITVAGKWTGSAGGATTILLDAAAETEGGDPRDPTDLINRRGEAFHIRAADGCRWRDFHLDGQAPVTANAGSGSDGPDHIHQTNGWDWSHKAFLWEYDTTDNRIDRLKITNFRGEMVYASGSTDPTTGERPGTITIDSSYLSDSNGSLFSCSASMTVTNCTVRSCYNGVENYCFASPTAQNTVISGNDIAPQVVATLTAGVVNDGLTYEITAIDGGADFTSVVVVNWETAASYYQNNHVLESGNYYRCASSHTSGTFATDLAAGKWVLVAEVNATGVVFRARSSDVPTWGTGGELSRTIGSNAIVVLGQLGTTTTISNNTVAGCNTGLLSTDFGHNFTISGNTWSNVTRVYVTSPIQTSSTTADFATHAGWDNWTISNETYQNTSALTQGVFVLQQSGTHIPHDWTADSLTFDAQNGYYVQRTIFQGGVTGTWAISNTDFTPAGPVANETNIYATTPRARITGCTGIDEITRYLSSDPQTWYPTTDGASNYLADVTASTVTIPSDGIFPDGMTITVRTTDEAFTLSYNGGSRAFSGVDSASFTYASATNTWSEDA